MTTLPLITQYPYPPKGQSTLGIVHAHTGKKVKFHSPTKQENNNVVNLVRALDAYEKNPNDTTLKTLTGLLNVMQFKAYRITEDENVLFFYPTQPQNYGISFMWRFGALKVPGKPNTYDNPVYPNAVTSPHEGTDGATIPAIKEFMLGGKFALFNAAHAHSAPPPSPLQHSRNLSDPSHSITLFVPFLKTALQELYPFMVESVIHGLGNEGFKLWFTNEYGNQFLLNKKSWPALLAVAMAQQDFSYDILVGSQLPGSIVDNKGVTRPLTTPKNLNNPVFRFLPHPPQTDVPCHLGNHASSPGSRGQRIDFACHMEHGGKNKQNSAMLNSAIKARAQAMDWNYRWDDRVHSLSEDKLPPEVLKNMRLFPQWFEDQLKLIPQDKPASVSSVPVEDNENDDPNLLDDNNYDDNALTSSPTMLFRSVPTAEQLVPTKSSVMRLK